MSIYATVFTIAIIDSRGSHSITAQSVPAHIGSPEDYPDGDPFSEFLPPAISADSEYARAVVFIGPNHAKGTTRSGQEYVAPLLTISGEEYAKSLFADLLQRLTEALNKAIANGPYARQIHT